jgi:hypothetical protein
LTVSTSSAIIGFHAYEDCIDDDNESKEAIGEVRIYESCVLIALLPRTEEAVVVRVAEEVEKSSAT